MTSGNAVGPRDLINWGTLEAENDLWKSGNTVGPINCEWSSHIAQTVQVSQTGLITHLCATVYCFAKSDLTVQNFACCSMCTPIVSNFRERLISKCIWWNSYLLLQVVMIHISITSHARNTCYVLQHALQQASRKAMILSQQNSWFTF